MSLAHYAFSPGGANPAWSRDGRLLYYRAHDGSFSTMVVDVSTSGDALQLGRPRVLITTAG